MSGAAIILTVTIVTSVIGLFSRKFLTWAVLRPYFVVHGSGSQDLIASDPGNPARGAPREGLTTSGFVHAPRGSGYAGLITSGFVHADVGHLLFNLITFYSFSFPLERTIGTMAFMVLYFCGLLISGIGTCIKHRDQPNYASLGASGAILAVLFASIVYFPRQRLLILPLPVPIPAPLFALAYLAFSYYSAGRSAAGQTQDRVNHDAHIFGALTGLAFVLLTNPRQFQVLLHTLTG